MDFSDAFAAVVAGYRTEKGLSKAALDEKAGLHQTYVGLLENSKRTPTLETANAIAAALGIPLSRLIERDRQ